MTTRLISAIITAVCLGIINAAAQVLPGIEVLKQNEFEGLRGKRVGLITNPTGIDNSLRSTIDILHAAPEVKLAALFAPEHGVRGDIHAGDHVDASVDAATGVAVRSIYGRNRKPTAEMLKDIDVLVYDIQDIGCRSYTFISTMGLAMQACAELGKEFMVLDRPNPLGGNKVEGNLVEDGCYSFVSQFPIPYIYGLTPGELALYLNDSGLLGEKRTNLTVVPMKGWKRSMDFRATGMPWVLPSPHIPTPESAVYYPMSGILGELTGYMSIGVGYTEPFKLFCAEWVDADKLAKRMNARALPGIIFRPIHIKPFYSTGQGKHLQGVEIYVTDMESAPLSLTQFYVMEELAAMYPAHKAFAAVTQQRLNMFDKVCGSKEIRKLFSRRYRVDDMAEYWNKDADGFRSATAKYHLYD
jgi:uncharacterized protein YbbC (DUF1343 family)